MIMKNIVNEDFEFNEKVNGLKNEREKIKSNIEYLKEQFD